MTTTPTPTRPPASPPRINPRIRERLIEVRREAGRRRLRILLVISSVICVGGLAFLTVTSPLLDVDRIDVVGGPHMTAAQLRAASGVHVHDDLLFVDTGAAARRLEQLPWVERATVKRDLPGTLKISVVEYTAAAYVRVSGGVILVAANGHVIARAHAAPAGAVEVRGVRRPPNVGELLAPPDAAGLVGRLPVALARRIDAVDVEGSGVALHVARGGQILLGSTRDLDAKAASALAVLARFGDRSFRYIDVSTPDRPTSHD
jgi:cell division protein FtsQ